MKGGGSVGDALGGLLIARRLARCCPTSLSLEDIASEARGKRAAAPAPLASFIPPAPSIVTEASPAFRVPMPAANHRFGFLLSDIKPIETAKQASKMRYELPNVKQVRGHIGRPVMVVSISETELAERKGRADDGPSSAPTKTTQ
jgi:hypothetical protein